VNEALAITLEYLESLMLAKLFWCLQTASFFSTSQRLALAWERWGTSPNKFTSDSNKAATLYYIKKLSSIFT